MKLVSEDDKYTTRRTPFGTLEASG